MLLVISYSLLKLAYRLLSISGIDLIEIGI